MALDIVDWLSMFSTAAALYRFALTCQPKPSAVFRDSRRQTPNRHPNRQARPHNAVDHRDAARIPGLPSAMASSRGTCK